MLEYNHTLKSKARTLRANMTDSERVLWSRLRGKQIMGVLFYRQKPIGNYIVDFYAPKAKVVVEVDGSQHQASNQADMDVQRDTYLMNHGLVILRFNNLQVLTELDGVMEVIYKTVEERLENKNPP